MNGGPGGYRALVLFSVLTGASAHAVMIKIETFPNRILRANVQVTSERIRVRQAREVVTLARLNLLPRLQIWRGIEGAGAVAGMTVGTEVPSLVQALAGLLEDIAPFLIPANWFRIEEAREMAEAQRWGALAWAAQELFAARTLALQVRHDEHVLSEFRMWTEAQEQLIENAQGAARWGEIPPERLRTLQIAAQALQDEQSEMQRMLDQEKRVLAWTLGIHRTTESFIVSEEGLPGFVAAETALSGVSEEWILHRTQVAAPELKQVSALTRARVWMQKQVAFSVFGNASIGGSGSLPFQQGLGFGFGASQKIQEFEKDALALQYRGLEYEIGEQLKRTQVVLESEREMRAGRLRAVAMAEQNRIGQRARSTVGLGSHTYAQWLDAGFETWNLRMQTSTRYLAAELKMMLAQERLRRLLWTREYQELARALPREDQ